MFVKGKRMASAKIPNSGNLSELEKFKKSCLISGSYCALDPQIFNAGSY